MENYKIISHKLLLVQQDLIHNYPIPPPRFRCLDDPLEGGPGVCPRILGGDLRGDMSESSPPSSWTFTRALPLLRGIGLGGDSSCLTLLLRPRTIELEPVSFWLLVLTPLLRPRRDTGLDTGLVPTSISHSLVSAIDNDCDLDVPLEIERSCSILNETLLPRDLLLLTSDFARVSTEGRGGEEDGSGDEGGSVPPLRDAVYG
jgi:hypothetical protein